MKNKILFLITLFFLHHHVHGTELEAPNLKLSSTGYKVTASWEPLEGAEGYALAYIPLWPTSEQKWEYLFLSKNETSISVNLWDGATFRVAVSAYDKDKKYGAFSPTWWFYTGTAPEAQAPFFPKVVSVEAARPTAKYALALVDCTYSNTRKRPCLFSELPLLGQETSAPTIEQIMQRVVVSHQWMKIRFEHMLQELPTEALSLFTPITAVVIASDIRPSNYKYLTGAIYLDPRNLWLTSAERDTINREDDYRSSFGNDLQYVVPSRYVKDNAYAYSKLGWSWDSRTIEDVRYAFIRTLIHELIHANDYFPKYYHSTLKMDRAVYVAARLDIGWRNRLSTRLTQDYSLQSEMMKKLGQVLFHGKEATEEQKLFTSQVVANEFASDIANDDYSYSTWREDLAMLGEETLMHYFYDIKRDIAFTNKPIGENISGNDYIITWGQRNRIATPQIKEKTRLLLSYVLPEIDFGQYLNSLSAPQPLKVGSGWLDSIDPNGARTSQRLINHHEHDIKFDLHRHHH